MSLRILRIISLCVGFLSMMMAGASVIFSIYTNAIKKKYGYSQSEVELISSISNLGFHMGCLPGILIEKLGPRSTSLAALLSSSGGYLLLWSATKAPDTYHTLAAVQCIYFVITSIGGVSSYLAAIVPNMTNFSPRFRGTIVSILDTGLSTGAVVFMVIYGGLFVNGHVTDEQNQDLQGYFLTMAIVSVVINGLGLLFLGYYNDPDELEVSQSEKTNLVDTKSTSDTTMDMTGLELLKNWEYQFIAWAFIFQSGLHFMFTSNVSVYLKSFSMEDQATTFNVLIPVSAVVAKLICGIVSDSIIGYISRSSMLLCFNILQTAAYLAFIFEANNYYAFLVILIVTGISSGAVWTLSPTLLSEFFGTKYFGRNWGWTLLGNAIFGIVMQKAFGVIYEAEISLPGETFCYGLKCFTWSSVMATVISACGVLFNIGLVLAEGSSKGVAIEYASR